MKCFNCGKELNNNLKYCTSCGFDLNNRVKYEKEIINNDEEEGRDIASDKTAVIAIFLTIVLGVFVVIVGIISINKYSCLYDCKSNVIEVEENEVVFNNQTEYRLFGVRYLFKNSIGSFTRNGFEIDDYGNDDSSRIKNITLRNNNLSIKVKAVNENSNLVPIDKYTISELNFIYNDNIKTNTMLELPEGITLYDSFVKVIDKYGKYDYQNDNCYAYKYSETTGHVEFCFNEDNLLNGFKIVNEVN